MMENTLWKALTSGFRESLANNLGDLFDGFDDQETPSSITGFFFVTLADGSQFQLGELKTKLKKARKARVSE